MAMYCSLQSTVLLKYLEIRVLPLALLVFGVWSLESWIASKKSSLKDRIFK